MRYFEHNLVDSPQEVPITLEEVLSQPPEWFTDPASTAPIIPFFRKEMFFNISFYDNNNNETFTKHKYLIPDDFYDRLLPALRLASTMFTKSIDYWRFISKAPIYRNPGTGIECFGSIQEKWRLRSWLRELEDEMELMSQSTQICWFRAEDSNNPDDVYSYGLTTTYHKPHLPAGPSELRYRMALSNHLFDALYDPQLNRKSPVEQCIVHVNFAITLVHELAHCLYRHRMQEVYLRRGAGLDGQIPKIAEPVTDSFSKPELGFTLEVSLFGGAVHAISDCRHNSRNGLSNQGLVFDGSTDLEIHTFPSEHSGRHITRKISDQTILGLLHESTWQHNGRVKIYLLPKNAV